MTNKISKILFGLSAVVAAAMIGCTTTSTPVVTTTLSTNSVTGVVTSNSVTNIVTSTLANTNLITSAEGLVLTTGTQLGVTAFLKSNPKDANYVKLISQALALVIKNGNYNATTFSSTLTTAIGSNAPAEVTVLVSDLINLYNGSESVVVANKLDANVFIATALQSVANGLAATQ